MPSSTNNDYMWRRAAPGQSCTAFCHGLGKECKLDFAAVVSAADRIDTSAIQADDAHACLSSTTSDGTPLAPYTSMGACNYGTAGTCDATPSGTTLTRLCPCGDLVRRLPPPPSLPFFSRLAHMPRPRRSHTPATAR